MGTVTPLRRRRSTASREALLTAATALFAERGFERTTVREIGERAGVDPAMIARYFGSKAALYIAALQAETAGEEPEDLLQPRRLGQLLERVRRRGSTPIFQSAVRAHDDPDVQEAARTALHDRLVAPLRARLERDGVDRPQLRAELAVAAFAGIVLGSSSGTFAALSAAPQEELLELVGGLLGSLDPRPRPDVHA